MGGVWGRRCRWISAWNRTVPNRTDRLLNWARVVHGSKCLVKFGHFVVVLQSTLKIFHEKFADHGPMELLDVVFSSERELLSDGAIGKNQGLSPRSGVCSVCRYRGRNSKGSATIAKRNVVLTKIEK